MKIIIGNDHAGYELKKQLISSFPNVEWLDIGCGGEKIDYPDIARKLSHTLTASPEINLGILICGTGIGMSIAANKTPGIRAAVCSEHYSAKYTRLHNDANVLCLGARTTGTGLAIEIADVFMNTEFEGGRHQTRVLKIEQN
jgi:ribose 5-phosphate isomerase B